MQPIEFEPAGALDCLTCLGKGYVTVRTDPLVRETCPSCCTGFSRYDVYQG